jgi:hypothetical protein
VVVVTHCGRARNQHPELVEGCAFREQAYFDKLNMLNGFAFLLVLFEMRVEVEKKYAE